jgi:signal transduction histidine kinase
MEFDLLRPILILEVASHLKRDLNLAEFTALNIGIDLISRRSVITYVGRQQKLIMDAANMQSRLFAFLSHDIRGGLNAVLMNIDLLKIDLPEDARFSHAIEDLEAMRRSILDTVGIMGRFLDAERLRTGKVQPKIAELNLQQLIWDVTGQFRSAASSKGLFITEEIPPDFQFLSDRELITMILQNLVGNAIKYSTHGTVQIIARAQPNGATRISVSDEGPGITPEKVSTLFEVFKRGETHGQAGLGLGLSIVDYAARLLGATITVDSKPDKGTTFHILLPQRSTN